MGLGGHLGQLGSVQRGYRINCSTEVDTEGLSHLLDFGSYQGSMNDVTQSLFVVSARVQQLLELGRVNDMLLRRQVRTGQHRAQEQGYDGT
jgi:ABC-type transporter Mla MlaB component